MYGYPALIKDEISAKIFGLNAARIYGINPDEIRCKITQTSFAKIKRDMDGELGPRRWALGIHNSGPRTRREFANLARWTGGRPG